MFYCWQWQANPGLKLSFNLRTPEYAYLHIHSLWVSQTATAIDLAIIRSVKYRVNISLTHTRSKLRFTRKIHLVLSVPSVGIRRQYQRLVRVRQPRSFPALVRFTLFLFFFVPVLLSPFFVWLPRLLSLVAFQRVGVEDLRVIPRVPHRARRRPGDLEVLFEDFECFAYFEVVDAVVVRPGWRVVPRRDLHPSQVLLALPRQPERVNLETRNSGDAVFLNKMRKRRFWSSLHGLGRIGAISQDTLDQNQSWRRSSRTYQIIWDTACACCGGAWHSHKTRRSARHNLSHHASASAVRQCRLWFLSEHLS